MIPVDINIYSDSEKSSFDDFFACSTLEKVQEHYDIIINSKQLDPLDVLRLVQENINYYKHPMNKEIEYAHISFYKVGNETKRAKDNMVEIETGLSMDGLLSTVTSVTNRSKYRTGFGIKNVLRPESTLIQTAIHLNELAVNSENGGDNPYLKAQSIVTKPMEIEEELAEALYEKSHWVTFIEPSFGLEYFDKHSHDLLVIHYSEQYTSSDQYDTITVTNKSKQYKQIIKEFLGRREVVVTDENLESIIKCFNSINGEWLLRIIGSQGEYEREKLSIVSAIKYGLAILDHPEIIWIPISMEEILRIAGAVKLNKSEGIFTIKNLKQNGVHSDDLLFIGISQKEDQIKLYYYPVEVKVGYNFSSVVDKGKNQIDNTYKLLKEQLSQLEASETSFKNKFFRNFFMQVLLTNEQKLLINEVWPEKHLEKIEELKAKLVNDAYQMTYALESYIGKGALISFKKDNSWKSIIKEDGKLLVELTEEDAYLGIAKTVQALQEDIQSGKTDIPVEKLLSAISLVDLKEEVKVVEEEAGFNQEVEMPQEVQTTQGITCINKESAELENVVAASNQSIAEEFKDTVINKEEARVDISEVAAANEKISEMMTQKNRNQPIKPALVVDENLRALIGEVEGSKHKVYWEFGHKGLGNRHMLIQGKSGQGKTYFIQCLLKELVEQGVPSLIIDYTDGFKASKLEAEFKACLGNRLVQYLVAKDKFPLNPFRKNQKELDEDLYVEEDSVDIAERFKSIISAVYKDLGVQQLNCIYQAVLRGLDKYGSKMNLKFLRLELEEDTAASAKTALAQLSLLIDKNPFDNAAEFDWSELEQQSGKVIIIQLAGFTRDVQRIITEMLLWDLWHYKVQHGSKDKPFTVVLDEAQNLDFGESSPCTRILTEGRKFGWSAWFATQFLKGQMDTSEINRLQNAEEKIYFCPPDNAISDIAGSFTKDKVAKKEWEDKLTALKKGQCIVYGPTMDEKGELSSARVMTVNITSLNERIHQELEIQKEQTKKHDMEAPTNKKVKTLARDTVGEVAVTEEDTKQQEVYINEEKYPVLANSWLVISETEAIKRVDKSVFLHRGSGIPIEIRFFFEIEDMMETRQDIKLLYNGRVYEGRFNKDPQERTRIFWSSELGEEINDVFSDICKRVIEKEKLEVGQRPLMRFRKINSERYEVSFERK